MRVGRMGWIPASAGLRGAESPSRASPGLGGEEGLGGLQQQMGHRATWHPRSRGAAARVRSLLDPACQPVEPSCTKAGAARRVRSGCLQQTRDQIMVSPSAGGPGCCPRGCPCSSGPSLHLGLLGKPCCMVHGGGARRALDAPPPARMPMLECCMRRCCMHCCPSGVGAGVVVAVIGPSTPPRLRAMKPCHAGCHAPCTDAKHSTSHEAVELGPSLGSLAGACRNASRLP